MAIGWPRWTVAADPDQQRPIVRVDAGVAVGVRDQQHVAVALQVAAGVADHAVIDRVDGRALGGADVEAVVARPAGLLAIGAQDLAMDRPGQRAGRSRADPVSPPNWPRRAVPRPPSPRACSSEWPRSCAPAVPRPAPAPRQRQAMPRGYPGSARPRSADEPVLHPPRDMLTASIAGDPDHGEALAHIVVHGTRPRNVSDRGDTLQNCAA